MPDSFNFSLASAHPRAQAVMKEAFYFSPIEETAPFGSDDGSDAAYGFREWRFLNPSTSPVQYLHELMAGWQYPYFDYNELDTAVIKAYIFQKKEMSEAEIQQQISLLKQLSVNEPRGSVKELSDQQLREVVLSVSKQMNDVYLLSQDNAIIGIAFAQFVLEGRMDGDIKKIAGTAIKRQLLPLFIDRYSVDYRETRKEQLTKMLGVITMAES